MAQKGPPTFTPGRNTQPTLRHVDRGHGSSLALHLRFIENGDDLRRRLQLGLQLSVEIKPDGTREDIFTCW